jgi:hypothetical protein
LQYDDCTSRFYIAVSRPKGTKVIFKNWIKLHDSEPDYLSSSTNITRIITTKEIRRMGVEGRKENKGDTYRVLVANMRERDHSNYICPCNNNIKMDLKGTEWEGVDWIDLAQDRDK